MIDAETAPDKPVLARPKPGPWRIADIVDGRKLRIQLTAAALDNGSDPVAQRKRALDLIHAALFRGRMIAQERLEEGADGLDTAGLLSAVMDEALSALYDFTVVHIFRAHNPTEAERMAVVAVGGYGRSVLAPSSDVDLLFVRNYKQTAWAESVIEYMLYALWDIGLKVGHSFRTIDECIKLSREDVTIRTAILDKRFLFGDRGIYDKLTERFQKDVIAGRGAEFVAAKLQERARSSRARGRIALSRRAQCEGRQGRAARPADAVLARQVHPWRREASGSSRQLGLHAVGQGDLPARGALPVDGALPSPLPHRPRPKSACRSTCSPRWRRAWATPRART